MLLEDAGRSKTKLNLNRLKAVCELWEKDDAFKGNKEIASDKALTTLMR